MWHDDESPRELALHTKRVSAVAEALDAPHPGRLAQRVECDLRCGVMIDVVPATQLESDEDDLICHDRITRIEGGGPSKKGIATVGPRAGTDGVPIEVPSAVSAVEASSLFVRAADNAFAIPKSVTTAVPPETSTLSGLMSRCTTPRSCVLQRTGDVPEDSHAVGDRERLATGKTRPERLALDERHAVPRPCPRGRARARSRRPIRRSFVANRGALRRP